MATRFEVWFLTHDGQRVKVLPDIKSLQYARMFNIPGRFSIDIPYTALDTFIDVPDWRVEIWRDAGGSRWLEFGGFIRQLQYQTDDAGNTNVTLSGPDFTDLLNRRIIAYRVGTAQATATDNADDMMKSLVRFNLGVDATLDYKGDAETERDLSDHGFAVQPSLNLGPTIDKAYAWRNLLMTLQEISEASQLAGDATYFQVVYNSATDFEFQTYVDQPGIDRTASSNNPFVLSVERGNLSMPLLWLDFEREVTHVYAGGEGDSSISTTSRTIAEAESVTRKGYSVWNRREAFQDARMEDTSAQVEDSARARLHEGRGNLSFAAQVLDIPGSHYREHWDLGDKVTVTHLGTTFDVLIGAVNVTLHTDGKETITGQLRIV